MTPSTNSAVAERESLSTPAAVKPSVAIIGMGYVGLPTAIALRSAGHPIIGIDISQSRLAAIRDGRAELLDAEQEALAAHLSAGEFDLTDDIAELAAAAVVIVAVPTPIDEQRRPDLRPLRGACAALVQHARAGQTLVLTSTTYVGTTREMVVAPLAERGLTAGEDIFVAFAPERIDPGVKSHAQQRTPRVVGGVTEECFERAQAVLQHTCSYVHAVSSPEAAEMAKLTENTFRATNIALAFEFSEAARHYGLDPIEVIDAAGTKPYAFMKHYPSTGIGGHCIGVDPHYLLEPLRDEGLNVPVMASVMDTVAKRPGRFAERAVELLGGKADGRVLVVGACYKPGVADLRESAALEIIGDLDQAGVHVDYHDPLAESFQQDGRMWISVPPSTEGYDVVILTVAHPGQDLSWLSEAPVVIDGTYRTPVGTERELI